MKTRQVRLAGLFVAALLVAAPAAQGAENLASARELYAAAAYRDALAMLDGLLAGAREHEERQSIELYRILCLVALDRKAEADGAVEALIAQNPLYRPANDDVPPRLRTAFTDARRRLLPGIIQQHYAAAKAAFDQKNYAAAADSFGQVLVGLDDPDMADAAAQSPLADLRMLAQGFRDLSTQALAPAPAAAPAAEAPPVEIPHPNRVYGFEDRDVVAPKTIRQRVPPFQGKVTGQGSGIVEVLIDTQGNVESARMSVPLGAQYDGLVLSAAREWRYLPATLNGARVKFRKFVKVNLQPTPPE